MVDLPDQPKPGDSAGDLIGRLREALEAGEALRRLDISLDGASVDGETFEGQQVRVRLRGGLGEKPWQVDAVEIWPAPMALETLDLAELQARYLSEPSGKRARALDEEIQRRLAKVSAEPASTALKAMVEAMIVELRRQDVLFAPDGAPEIARTMITTGDSINLEKVARAGLLAIREPDDSLYEDGGPLDPDIIGYDRVPEVYWQAFIDAITKGGE